MSLTPAQRDAMQKALTALQSLRAPTMTLVAMQDEAIFKLSTALSQEPAQPAEDARDAAISQKENYDA